MFAAKLAELGHLKFARNQFLVFGRPIIFILAHRTLHWKYIILRHSVLCLMIPLEPLVPLAGRPISYHACQAPGADDRI